MIVMSLDGNLGTMLKIKGGNRVREGHGGDRCRKKV